MTTENVDDDGKDTVDVEGTGMAEVDGPGRLDVCGAAAKVDEGTVDGKEVTVGSS